MFRILVILVFSAVTTISCAQQTEVVSDSILQTRDSIRINKSGKVITVASYAKRYQPRKALLYAAVLPGAGQVYNKKYWKLPFVYGGFAAITYGVIYYNNAYSKYKNELFGVLESGSATSPSGFTEEQLRTIVDEARRQRDFFLILDAFMYILQMVDAHVDAHLKEFDLNPQLKVSLKPTVQQNVLTGRTSGFSLTFRF
ncbi:MAG TPA: DUF5683 domain-containing protein, partial [Cyclobacteriaceae bacterium]|nr:DUF5683 domain-containing protein [Cyclobacteriaceae bacterium]